MTSSGTWLKPGENEVKDKANAFAVKEGYAEFENVLFPRAGAFLALLDECRQEAHCLDALYDVTVAYSKPYHPVKIGTANPPSVLLLSGGGPDAPKEVHFHVKRFPLPAGMPEGEEGVTKWLFDNYVEKEALLNKFEAANPHTFPGPERSTPLDLTNLVLHQLFLLASLLALLHGMRTWLGQTTVLAFLGFGVVAAAAAATGDSNPALEKGAPVNLIKKKE